MQTIVRWILIIVFVLGVIFGGILRPVEAQALPLKSGEWTLYGIIQRAAGVGPSFNIDLTRTEPRPITLSLSADGNTVRLTGVERVFNGEVNNYFPEVELLLQTESRDGRPVYARRYTLTPCPPEQDPCLGVEDYLLILTVVSPERAELVTSVFGFEFGINTRHELRFGPADSAWIDAELAGPRCGTAPAPHLRLGESATIVLDEGVALLREARLTAPIQRTIRYAEEVTVLNGPFCVEGSALWEVQAGREVGYMMEGAESRYWVEQPNPIPLFQTVRLSHDAFPATALEPRPPAPISTPAAVTSCPGNAPSRLKIGGQGRILPGDPNRINTLPARPSLNPESRSLGRMAAGSVFRVLDGPVCNHDITWWLVEYQGIVGWTGEMQVQTYWAEPVE